MITICSKLGTRGLGVDVAVGVKVGVAVGSRVEVGKGVTVGAGGKAVGITTGAAVQADNTISNNPSSEKSLVFIFVSTYVLLYHTIIQPGNGAVTWTFNP
jgi:hypothetical protein